MRLDLLNLRFLALVFLAAIGTTSFRWAGAAVTLAPVLQDLASPVYVANAHDGTNRLFVVEQAGRVRVLAAGASQPTLFLDIVAKVLSGGERGLLGLAFHPQFAINARFFVNYTRRSDGATVIAEYRAAADPAVTAASESIFLVVAQPFANHNGGMIEFGSDGFLYIGMGDGGSSNDPQNRAQNINDLLGKILRIDIDHPAGPLLYSSPPGNPYAGATPGRDEIFAIGFRNPFRFSFDRATGQLYVGDVGQNQIEEIDIVTVGGNYGWRVYEGTQCTGIDPQLCDPANYSAPIAQYNHTGGRCSVIGGYVYRGSQATLPQGTYAFADYCSGEIFTLSAGAVTLLLSAGFSISSFGEDESGELYVVGLGGTVHRLRSTPPGGINVALAANGGVATSSSNFSSGTTPPGAINGDRKGLNWNNGGGWKSAAGMPQWLQVQFAGQRTIDRVIVYDVQDNFQNPVEPTDTMTNPVYGSSFVNFTVSAHNGADFVVVASVTGNNLVKRTVTFPAVTTDRIRVTVTASADPYARFTEVEAFTVAQAGPAPTSTTLASSLNPAPAGASVTFTATVNGTNPTGNVGFTDNGNPIAGCTAVALTGAGHIRTAACSTSSLAVGTHPITASYAGDPGNAASASPPLSQVITAPPPGSINVALAANGGVATSSSNFSSGTTPPGAINGDRKGLNWNNGGGWKSAAGMPQWLQVQFAGQRTIDRVIVYDVQDNFQNPVEPTDTMTNPVYGSSFVNFTVSAYNGADFVVVASVTGNNLVKRTVTFPAVTTDRIRVTVTASADPYARFTEVEAFTVAVP